MKKCVFYKITDKNRKITCDFFIFIMIFIKIGSDFRKNYEKIVKSTKFVILTIAFFWELTIMVIGSWHSNILSANASEILIKTLTEILQIRKGT